MSTYERKIPILDCGHEYARKILHGRWKIAILLRITGGIFRPGEISRSIPQATRRVLESQLAELLSHNIITKQVYDGKVKRVEYKLTDLGISLMPVIEVMGQWGNNNINELKKTLNKQ